jgi:N-acetylneuraminic acid mutarotase
MKRHIVWMFAALVATVLLSLASISPAEEGEWTQKSDMPTARFGLSTSVLNGKIYAIGGWGRGVEVPTVEAYDPLTDMWTKKADITARGELSTSAVGEHIYAIGGVTGWDYSGILSLVEEYDPESIVVEPREKLPTKWGEVKSE